MASNNVITLYRGDADKISRFEFSRTYKGCLVGQGVYLTNNIEIADSYRTKGAWGVKGYRTPFTATVGAGNKNLAKNVAAQLYGNHRMLDDGVATKSVLKAKNPDRKYWESVIKEFWEKIENSGITIERVTVRDRPGPHFCFTETAVENRFGYVTVFEFPEPNFSANVVDVGSHHIDPLVFDLLADLRFWKKESGYNKFMEAFTSPRKPLIEGSVYFLGGEGVDFNKLRKQLVPYGVHGFEYKGGTFTGGRKHRAFCIFDEDYVNDHKVKRFK